jgi:hypothetical protein
MTDLNISSVGAYAEHVPDHSTELDPNGLPFVVELPGHIVFGFVIDGVKVPVGKKGEAGIAADKARQDAVAKAEADHAAAQQRALDEKAAADALAAQQAAQAAQPPPPPTQG